jgi:large subunit ribosomal protein L19
MANQIKWQDKIEFSVGDTIQVAQAIKDGDKTRIQAFQGIVIAIRGTGAGKNFIVRKIATGAVGVEKIFPIDTPTITGIEIIKKGKVRRAKLYYLRNRLGKKATKIKDVFVRKVKSSPDEISTPAPVGEKTEKVERVRPEPTTKSAPKPEVVKEKKAKKGPKKIVRKERKFVR